MTPRQELLRYLKTNASMLVLTLIEALTDKVVYGETVRCAALIRQRGCERNLIGTSIIADDLLATSPGKGGG